MSVQQKARELLPIQPNLSPPLSSKSLVIYFFISLPVSRISEEQEHRYPPEMCSSVLLLRSDKGATLRETQVHAEPLQKTTFLSLKRGSAWQWKPIANERVSWWMRCSLWRTWRRKILFVRTNLHHLRPGNTQHCLWMGISQAWSNTGCRHCLLNMP